MFPAVFLLLGPSREPTEPGWILPVCCTGVAVRGARDHPAEARRQLVGWGVAEGLALDNLLEMGQRFSRWLSARWPGGRARREWPVEHGLPKGTVVRGKIDNHGTSTTLRARNLSSSSSGRHGWNFESASRVHPAACRIASASVIAPSAISARLASRTAAPDAPPPPAP